jgi:uncharacterized protein YbjT (DUF2867 family)
MRVLLCGASGFLGRHILAALQAQGHTVVCAGSMRNAHNQLRVDYAQDTSVAAWLPRLEGIDAVINAVGVLRDSQRRPIEAVHSSTPIALFDACNLAGQQRGQTLRVIQISALGIEGNATRYASTKRVADEHLLGLHASAQVNATVLRPSIVFGKGGQSSQLFVQLSKLPVLLLPQAVLTAQVQPVAVQDLASAVAWLVAHQSVEPLIECVGPQALSLSTFIASLRQQQALKPARVMPLPQCLTRLSVSIGDRIPAIPWCSETQALLAKDNVSISRAFAQLLGHAPLPVQQFWSQAWNH